VVWGDLAAVNARGGEIGIDVRTIAIGRQPLCVATTRGPEGRPPLLLFSGIGANWQLAKPFLHALTNTAAITFDVPGIGGSPLPSLPYRPSPLPEPAAGAAGPSSDIGRSMSPGSRGAAGSLSNSPISTATHAESSYWQRPRRARSWYPADPQWSGSSRHRGATSTTTTCAA